MDDLTAFLTARLDEDEAAARAAMPTGGRRNGKMTQRRVLADIEAKRRIVAEFEQVHVDYRTAHTPTLEGQRLGLLKAVAVLALPFADHADYREEWRP